MKPTAKSTTQRRAAIEQRLEEQRRQKALLLKQQTLKRRLYIGGGIAAGIVILVLIVTSVVNTVKQKSVDLTGVVTFSNLSQDHVTGTVNYPQNPPVGGAHSAMWLTCGNYDQTVQNENAVHSMEHGAVWITYQPSLSTADVTHLRNLVKGHSYIVLSPYPNLPTPVVMSAWGKQLKLTSANDARVSAFIDTYENGPQTKEPGASCSGGVGSPIQP